MKTQVIDITPEMAKKMLEKNTGNRPLQPSVVAAYAPGPRRTTRAIPATTTPGLGLAT